MDGLPTEIYKKCDKILLLELLEVLNDAFQKQRLPESMQEMIIIVIPKQGKDPMLPNLPPHLRC